MIEKRYTTTFSIIRKTWTTEIVGEKTIDKAEESIVSSFLAYRQQASADYVQSLGLQISRPFMVWCARGEEVAEGDVLSSTYGFDKVRFIQDFPDGLNPHKEIIVEHVGDELTS